ncbi:MAG: YceI family protein [Gallionella sp.]
MPAKNRSRYLTGLFTCALTICALSISPPSQAESEQVPADFPEAHYRQARESGKKILRVASAQSLVVIEVHRAGPAAWLGHDHVVASHNLSGYVSMAEGLADLLVSLEHLVVDEAELRTEAGFNTQPSQEDIEATRRNMLKETLDSERFPYAYIHIARLDANPTTLNVSITLHGITRNYEIQPKIEADPSGIAVDGRMSFNQSDFGITPLSVLGGALQVQDKLDLRFHIRALNN